MKTNSQIFKLSEKSFTIVDELKQNATFLIWIKKIQKPKFDKNLSEKDKYYHAAVVSLKNNIYSSYDTYINEKYKVEINYQTLDRLKNQFR